MKTYISAWPPLEPPRPFPRALCILGSTGSIGTNAMKVVEAHPELFRVTALAAGRNVRLLAEQAARHRPGWLSVADPDSAEALAGLLPAGYRPEILSGPKGAEALAGLDEADLVLSSIVGAAGFLPTLAAARAGKTIALANKESLVLGGAL
ncbi:MAG: 1-deoxy-D-xylulose-5-phosphate reductoisomerase, partial [Desulfovibrionaceae bacterium]|nr:1-deoxy-D-xylulose-5-phosphate reductoisomerase [Desulfovibrionaceae bacterium]